MSRKYLNNRWCVRCPKKDPTPYLKKNYSLMVGMNKDVHPRNIFVVDAGCGNGRNSIFMAWKGHSVMSLDMIGDYGCKMILGKDQIPRHKKADIILCNYVMMFLNNEERNQIINEFQKIANTNCTIMVELYPAKDSYAPTHKKMLELQKKIFNQLGWEKIRYSQGRFIARIQNKQKQVKTKG